MKKVNGLLFCSLAVGVPRRADIQGKKAGKLSNRNRRVAHVLAGLSFLYAPAALNAKTPLDYMVQQVCDDGTGGHTSADPVTCPTRARKLRIGEPLPYHKWDSPTFSSTAQISDSYPIADLYGRTRVIQTMFFTRETNIPFFNASNGRPGNSAYDLLIADGNYVSYAGTYDNGRGWQPFWSSSTQCSFSDSWLVAPKAAALPFGEGHTYSSLTNSAAQCPAKVGLGTALTVWNFYAGFPFASGKSLNAIKTWHFSGDSLDSDAIEVFYHTKEYGKTRWEAWSSTATAANAIALSRCPTGVGNGTAQFGNTIYYLQDCHDWTFIRPSDGGDWDPRQHWHVDPLYNSYNLLSNTHMQCTDSQGRPADCGYGGLCRSVSPWQRTENLNWGYDQALMRDHVAPHAPWRTHNCALIFSVPTSPNGHGIYQDVAGTFPHTKYTFGVSLWAPNENSSLAEIVVFEVAISGMILARHAISASPSTFPKFFKGSFTKNPNTAWMRFQVYANSANVTYEMTDAWIAPDPS